METSECFTLSTKLPFVGLARGAPDVSGAVNQRCKKIVPYGISLGHNKLLQERFEVIYRG